MRIANWVACLSILAGVIAGCAAVNCQDPPARIGRRSLGQPGKSERLRKPPPQTLADDLRRDNERPERVNLVRRTACRHDAFEVGEYALRESSNRIRRVV